MELDDLRSAWTNAGQTAGGPSLDELIPRIRRLRRIVLWRDAREIVAAAFVAPIFVWIGWQVRAHGGPLAARVGIGLVLAGLPLIVAVLLWARRPRAYAGASIDERLRAELTYLNRQIFILEHVVWWYVAPVLVGVNLFVESVRGAQSVFAVTYLIVTLAASIFLIWLNRRAAHRLRPTRDSVLRGLDEIGAASR